MEPGTPVRFTANALGAYYEANPYRFAERTFGYGDTGTVADLPAAPALADWIIVQADDDPDLFVPVHPSMVEAITP